MNERDLDTTLDLIHAELRRAPVPSALRARVSDVPATAGRPRWSVPSIRQWRFQSMWDAAKLVVGGVVVALFSGLLLAGPLVPAGGDVVQIPGAVASATPEVSVADTATDVPAPERVPGLRLPQDPPDGVRSGSIAAGDEVVRWIHLASEFGAFPDQGYMLPTANGIAVHDREGGTLMHTEDGISWSKIPSPAESWQGRVAYVNDVYWFIDPRRGRLWRSSDLFEWQELDASVMREATKGWNTRRVEVLGPVVVNGEIQFWIDYQYALPLKALGVTERGATYLQETAEGRFWVCVDKKACRAGKPTRVLQIKNRPEGLRIIDRDSGEQLGFLEGADYGDLYEGRRGAMGVSYAIAGDTVAESLHGRPAHEIDLIMSQQPPEDTPDAPFRLHLTPGERPVVGAVPLGSHWLASQMAPGGQGDHEGGERWIHAGGEWASLASLGLPELGPEWRDPVLAGDRGVAAPGKNGLGDVVLLWYHDGDIRHLWVLTVQSAVEPD